MLNQQSSQPIDHIGHIGSSVYSGVKHVYHSMSPLNLFFIFITITAVILFVIYLIYMSRLMSVECNNMNSLYSSVNTSLKPINNIDPDCSGNLCEYFIMTAFNACSGGNYKNDYVNICNLVAVIKEGVRCLDFEIYAMDDDEPVVATSTIDNTYVKETYNYVSFSDVMTTIKNYAFATNGSVTCPNFTDPLIIHLRFQSNNQQMFTNLAKLFESYDSIMLGSEYSYENHGRNIGKQPLLSFRNKIILIVDRSTNSFLENRALLEYVNLTSNSLFAREYAYSDIVINPDVQELTIYNEQCMTLILPNPSAEPSNPSGNLCREYGCQMVAMCYQLNDQYLQTEINFFNTAHYAFVLKPASLLQQNTTIPEPVPQIPEYSYQPRVSSTDYYNYTY
jgi:hypothetical protein